jgi:hypothetical protein
MFQRFQHWLSSRHGPKSDNPHQIGEETPNDTVFVEKFFKIGIIGGPGQTIDLSDSGFQRRLGDGRKDCFVEIGIDNIAVQNQTAHFAQSQRGGVQVAKVAKAGLPSLADGVGKNLRHNDIEQVKNIVLSAGFERPNEGKQRRKASIIRQSRDGLSLGGACKPR